MISKLLKKDHVFRRQITSQNVWGELLCDNCDKEALFQITAFPITAIRRSPQATTSQLACQAFCWQQTVMGDADSLRGQGRPGNLGQSSSGCHIRPPFLSATYCHSCVSPRGLWATRRAKQRHLFQPFDLCCHLLIKVSGKRRALAASSAPLPPTRDELLWNDAAY